MRFERLGWIVAAALAGGIAAAGFQGSTEKSGTVDLAKVFNDSEYAKKQTESLRNMGQARQGVIDFIRQNPHMKTEDTTRFRELSVKEAPTAPEKAELERIKNDAQASETKFRELSTKDKPSQAELTQLEELNRRKDNSQQVLDKWNQDFAAELQQRQEGLRNDTLARVKDAVSQVAKTQGYTIVFVQDVAPYSAHDLTADALKAMNGKK
jgi:Skp family chaperone for outer membrane proteins